MRAHARSRTGICAVCLALFILGGVRCGGHAVEPVDVIEMLARRGWEAFEEWEFTRATTVFREVVAKDASYADGYNGLGWSLMNLDSLESAVSCFDAALARGLQSADPYAGMAVVCRDAEPVNLRLVLAMADSALARDMRYIFRHDPCLDWRDLRLILAQCHFALGEYGYANVQVDSLGGDVQDPGRETFVEDLLREIEELGEQIRCP